MVAAQQDQGERTVDQVHKGLDLVFGRVAGVGQGSDGADAGSGERGGGIACGPVVDRGEGGGGPFDVGGVPAGRAAGHVVLAGRRLAHELDRGTAAPGPRGRLYGEGVEAEAPEDADVGVMVKVERPVQALVVEVERVGVLHGELADPQQPRLGAWLIPELGLDLVPELGEVTVRGELKGEGGEDLLVGHAQGQLGTLAVGEAEHLVAHRRPTPRLLPHRRRVHGRQQELLAADGVHLGPHDGCHLLVDPPTQRQHGVVAGLELADEPAAHEQPVAGGLGLGRCVAQGGDEQVGPAHRCRAFRGWVDERMSECRWPP